MEFKYIIIDYSEFSLIDLSEFKETNESSLRYSVDGSKIILKWTGNTPSSLSNVTSKSEEYTIDQILVIMDTDEWRVYDPSSGSTEN
jgi:hypothetical protein